MLNSIKFPPIATSLMILSVIILCGLGNWQLERLKWKTDLLTELDQAYNQTPKPLTKEDFKNGTLKRGTVTGRYDHSHEIKIIPRTHDGKNGSHIIAPFKTNNGQTILVNRGWLPINKNTYIKPKGTITLSGLIRKPSWINPMVPQNEPDRNIWYRLEIDEIVSAKNIKDVTTSLFYLDQNDHSETYPLSTALTWQPRNSHLSYAIFWFTMAGTLIAIYVIRFILPQIKKGA